jgi:lantibiotic modifying enzyme
MDMRDVELAFSRARINADAQLPGWAESLMGVILTLPTEPTTSQRFGINSVEAVSQVFLEGAQKLLGWNELLSRFPFLRSEVLPCLTTQLATRVALACGATLELENITRSEFVWDFSRDAWIERLCGFAGLNFVVGTAIRQWRQSTLEIIGRLGRDLSRIENHLFGGRTLGPLIRIDADLGDRHNDGRAVAALTFVEGQRIVYKPKDASCAIYFSDLLSILNESNTSAQLKAPQILSCGFYSWEQYIDQEAATTELETSSFFWNFGSIIRLLQTIEGRDFWIDNLRIHKDSPIFVDLECILHPRVEGEGFQVRMFDLAPDLYEESVLPTGAVTQPIEIPGVGRQDFGGLSAGGPRALPLGMWSGYKDRRNGNIWLKSGRLYWEPEAAWPRPAGKMAEPADYLDQIEGGYREMQGVLARNAQAILASKKIAVDTNHLSVRTLLRSTWEYLVLLRASLEPSVLLDGNAREVALANVVSTAHQWGAVNDHRPRLRVAISELNAIRMLDIPEFFNSPPASSVVDTAGVEHPHILIGDALARLRTRLINIDAFDLESHIEILLFAVGSMRRRRNSQDPWSHDAL